MLESLYDDKSSPFEKLLEQDKFVTIRTRNLQILATEMFKVYRNIFPPIFSEIFHRCGISYNLLWGWYFFNKEVIKIFSSNQRSSNPRKHSLEVFWKKKWKRKTQVTSSNLQGKSSNPRVTSSNPWDRTLKPRVARIKTRVGRLKARVGRLKACVRRLKARVEAIKPRVR